MKEDYKNRIITISGEPVSGKSTTIKAIIDKLEKAGISKEDIHFIQTGHKFRDYFNKIIEIINCFDDDEKVIELSKSKEIQKLIQNPRYRDSLIRTILYIKQKGEDLSNFTIEMANNSKAFSGLRKIVDLTIDQDIADLGKEINEEEHPNEVWLIDSRLAFANIPNSFSIRLVADPKVAGERLLADKSRGKEDSQYKSIEEAINARESRRKGEQARYLRRYGIDLEDENNYDLVIDTSSAKVEDIATTILECEEKYKEGKTFEKTWFTHKRKAEQDGDER